MMIMINMIKYDDDNNVNDDNNNVFYRQLQQYN